MGWQDLEPLGSLKKLSLLSLIGNPVTLKPNYRRAQHTHTHALARSPHYLSPCAEAMLVMRRLYVISKLTHLKVLDFKKIKQKVGRCAQSNCSRSRFPSIRPSIHPSVCPYVHRAPFIHPSVHHHVIVVCTSPLLDTPPYAVLHRYMQTVLNQSMQYYCIGLTVSVQHSTGLCSAVAP